MMYVSERYAIVQKAKRSHAPASVLGVLQAHQSNCELMAIAACVGE